jgi:ankyrin repeat protein
MMLKIYLYQSTGGNMSRVQAILSLILIGLIAASSISKSEAQPSIQATGATEQKSCTGKTKRDLSSPLMVASAKGDVAGVRAAFAKAASVNGRNKDGETALIIAADGGFSEIVELLLEKGADVKAKSADGVTALMAACCNGDIKSARAIVEKGAEVNAKNNDSVTPLMYAAEAKGDQVDLVKFLLEKGADINAKDSDNDSALGYAEFEENKKVFELLKKAQTKK